MMKKYEKSLSVFVIVMMLFSIIPIPVFAQEANENIALNAEVTGTNAEDGSAYSAIVDGDKSDAYEARLSSDRNTKPTIILDLGDQNEVQFFRLFLEDRQNVQHKNNLKTYQITFSNEEDFTGENYRVQRTLDTETIQDDVLLSKSLNVRYVKIETLETHEDSTWDNVGFVEFELYKSPSNLAIGAEATGENAENQENTPDKVVDGNYDTKFSSARDTVLTLELDLGEIKQIQYLRLFLEERTSTTYKNNLKKYKVVFSEDADFTTIVYETERELDRETTNDELILDEPIQARYVKMSDIETHQDAGWDNVAILELELFDSYFNLADLEGGPGSIDDVRPVYDEALNKVVFQEVDGYTIENNGADFEQIVDKDFNVYQPLTDKVVNLSLKITNNSTKEVTITDELELVIPGLYEESIGNDKPSVSPELAEWYSDSNNVFTATNSSRIVIEDKHKSALQSMAEEFKEDYLDITGKSIEIVYGNNPEQGDFYFTLDSNDTHMGEEGYYIEITDKVTVSATHKTGAYWSTRTLLQILTQEENKNIIPSGVIRDYPKYEVRGFMLDVARKPFSMEILEDFAKNMAWHKMNDLQIHLSDNYIFLEDYGVGETELEAFKAYDAFRLESDVKNAEGESATAKDYAYSKKEFQNFILENRKIGVNIVPEIDIPAHANSFTKVFPEIMVKNQRSSLQNKRPLIDHIDISKPAAVDKVKEIFDDYTNAQNAIFDSETVVHIGADEFLSDYTAYRNFVNEFVPYIKETNPVRMWGGLSWIKDNPLTEIDKEAIENVQMNLWSRDWADGLEMYNLGYQLINTIDTYMYMVPNGSGGKGAYQDYLNTDALFNNFEPNLLSTKSGWKSIPAGSDQMLGAVFAIWNDNIDKKSSGLTEVDMYKRFQDALPVISEKTWANGKEKGSLKNIQETSNNVGLAPNSNPLLQQLSKGDVHANYTFEKDNELNDSSENNRDLSNLTNASFEIGKGSNALDLKGNESYINPPLDKIGEGTELSFDLKLEEANEGDILFENDSPYGTHDIRIMEDGKLGFTREIHDYTFDYELPVGKWVNLKIKTSNLKTALYVNDEFIDFAIGKFVHNDMVKKEGITNSTFALPLQRIGSKNDSIKGKIDNVIISKAGADDENKIPNSNITVEATSEYTGEEADKVIDGDPNTLWHSDWSDSSVTLPQTLTFTFNEAVEIDKMTYLPRQNPTNNGDIKTFDLYITDENGTEEKVISNQTLANNKSIKTIKFDQIIAKQVRLVITGSYGDTEDRFASAAEIAFYPPVEIDEEEIDKSELENLISSVESVNSDLYTVSSFDQEALDQAIAFGKQVLEKYSIGEDNLQEAITKIQDVIDSFIERGDVGALSKLIEEYANLNAEDYTQGTWNVFIKTVDNASEIVADNSDSSQADVDAAYEALIDAKNKLEKIEDITVDKKNLEQAVSDANEKEESDFTPKSWSVFATALADAQAVLADEDVTQEEVDLSLTDLQSAVDGLEAIKDPVETPEKDKDSDDVNVEITDPDNTKDNNNELPKTATSIYNWILMGLLLASIGMVIHFTRKKIV